MKKFQQCLRCSILEQKVVRPPACGDLWLVHTFCECAWMYHAACSIGSLHGHDPNSYAEVIGGRL